MPRLLDQLHHDHQNLATLLRLLEEQVERLKADGDADLCLTVDIIDYIQAYPNIVHHPREDLLYHYYLRHYDGDKARIHGLLAEHEEIISTTTALRTAFESLLNDGMLVISRQQLVTDLEQFIAWQKRHMETEEREVFPMLAAAFSPQDWQAIEALDQAASDPLFGEVVQESFRGLYERITAE